MTLHPVPNTSMWARLVAKFSVRSLGVILASLILVVLGAGTVTAANRAMPGQLLYSVKTQINEPARSLLIFDADTKAAYEAGLAAKRADEAEALQNSGKLDQKTQDEISQNFDSHVQSVQNRLGKIKDKNTKQTQDLLDEAKDQVKKGRYNQAAKIGRQISDTARQRFQFNLNINDSKSDSDNSGRGSGDSQ